jgi:hypothetical protein
MNTLTTNQNLNNPLNPKKCDCSYHQPRCSQNKNGEQGECQYWQQCGVVAFYCQH